MPHLGCSVQVRRICFEPKDTDILRNRSRNILECGRRKPGTKPGSFSEWSPSWSGVFCLSCQQANWLRTSRDLLLQKRTKINFVALVQIGCEARQVFVYPVQLSMEALKWNPLEKDCYGNVYEALDRLEKVVKFLEGRATSLGEDACLKQLSQYEVQN